MYCKSNLLVHLNYVLQVYSFFCPPLTHSLTHSLTNISTHPPTHTHTYTHLQFYSSFVVGASSVSSPRKIRQTSSFDQRDDLTSGDDCPPPVPPRSVIAAWLKTISQFCWISILSACFGLQTICWTKRIVFVYALNVDDKLYTVMCYFTNKK